MSDSPRRRGSHTPSLSTWVRRAISEEALIARGDRVLVACSGGHDSMALLHVLCLARGKHGFSLVAHGVDHGLRPLAEDELALAGRLAAAHEVPWSVTRVDLAKGGNLQERARVARHLALEEARVRSGAVSIALAHTMNDRAETLVMRLVRGTGPRGLAVMPSRAGYLIRPILRATREDVLRHLSRHGVESADDPSNADPRFWRTRVRHEVLPLLESLSPRAIQAIAGLAEAMCELPIEDELTLGRGQREALRRAASRGKRGVQIRTKGNTDTWVDAPLAIDNVKKR